MVRARDGGEYLRMQGDTGLLVPGLAAGGHAVCVDDWWKGPCLTKRGGDGMKVERRGGPLGVESGARLV
jgi:hypothetical protein